ncbi:MAG: DCC1-like thiol-disulfide oxidoreductase family protein [Bacteroidetes bacterium]|nr:DCC1-like thiol-disulfide oxidoreductase family protein [Bacteroidota bacterium]
MDKSNHIILFDGVCNLCNGFVQFVIKRDNKAIFKFASLQSTFGQNHLLQNNLSNTNLTSFIYIRNGATLTKSTAALYVLKDLSSWMSVFFIFIIIPAFIRNFVYDIIAKNRYKWFGKNEQCMLPTKALQERFYQ